MAAALALALALAVSLADGGTAWGQDAPVAPQAQTSKPKPGSGLIVRLDATGISVPEPVIVRLTNDDGTAVDLALADDGRSPDVAAEDGMWTGGSPLVGDHYQVTLLTGDTTYDGGVAHWAGVNPKRDLALRLVEGRLELSAGVSSDAWQGATTAPSVEVSAGPAPGGGPGAGPPPAGAPGGEPARPDGQGVTRVPPADAPIRTSTVVVFAWGATLLAGAAWLWTRARSTGGRLPPRDLRLVPEPGLLGPVTPSLSEGLQVWELGPGGALEAVAPILATLARDHRVIVSAPAHTPVPSVLGGPVWRVDGADPRRLGDLALALSDLPGAPVTVLLLGTGQDAALLKAAHGALPAGLGGIVLLAQAGALPLPTLRLSRAGEQWQLSGQGGEQRLRAGPRGLERVD